MPSTNPDYSDCPIQRTPTVAFVKGLRRHHSPVMAITTVHLNKTSAIALLSAATALLHCRSTVARCPRVAIEQNPHIEVVQTARITIAQTVRIESLHELHA